MIKRPTQVLIVDDEAIIRRGVVTLLNGCGQIQVIGKVANFTGAIELVEKLKPDVVVSNLLMPMMNGIETIRQIIALHNARKMSCACLSWVGRTAKLEKNCLSLQ